MDKLMTTQEVADRLGVHLYTVQGWVRNGRLEAYRLANRDYRFSEEHINAFLDGCSTKKEG